VFLGINRRRLVAPPIEAYAAMTSLAAGEMDEAMLAAWVQRHSTRRPAT